MPAFRVYIKGTYFCTAYARDDRHVMDMIDIQINEKGVEEEPEGMMEHDYMWEEVKQK